ncbi:UNVERIFIED_CONTAM: hypothetical protein Scaly_2242700 [Sesamum calycinum]|uniref:Transposase MuDR plant domain-containing protein n=1 Tax=Sesamum calycinum TaxID=2727403 RepID=A0AAW2MC98_9LAMI
MSLLLDGINFEEFIDAGDDQGFVFEGVSQRQGCEGQGVDRDEFEGDKEGLDGEGQGLEGQVIMGLSLRVIQRGRTVRGRPIIDGDSDTPSLVLEDIEVESDDDIFSNKNPTKLELVKKLKKVMKDSQKAKLKQKICDVREEDWLVIVMMEDLESLPGSDEEPQKKCPVFKDSTSLKSLNLVVGMKFKDAKQFREVLRDWCVRNGYDIEFIKNETSRITAKCKVDGCEWRIHASPIMKGPTFQIKTLKGNHTCARTYENSLAKATYLATRMESSIRDHPDIPIQQLKNRILRKCNVEVSRFKVLRAKKKALEAIRGFDALQYDKLWDYCETVRKCNPGSKKGLIEALKELVPDSEHRFCTRHMYQNFKQKFKSVELKEYFWKAASTANKQDFERYMKKIQEIDPKVSEDVETASEWLEKRSLPEEIPQGSQAPPTSQEQVRKRDPKNNTPTRQKGRKHVPLRKSAATREEVTYKGPRNATLLGMTAPIQTTVEQTPMATNLGTNDGSGGPSHSIPEKGKIQEKNNHNPGLGHLFYSGI